MKTKGLIAGLILVLLIFPLVSAVEVDMKDNYQQGETMLVKVSGNFVTQITNDNVFFYSGHDRIPVDWGMAEINSDYYIYASLVGKSPGNYSISIEGVKYMKGNEVLSDNIVRNFTITNSTADFSLKPGVVASSGDFSLEVQNLIDNQISVTVTTQTANDSERDVSVLNQGVSEKTASFPLNSGQIQKIDFAVGEGSPTFQTVTLSSSNLTYNIPVYIFSPYNPITSPYEIVPSQLISSVPTNTLSNQTIYIYNTGTSEVKNISLYLSDSISPFVNLSQNYIDNLAPSTNVPIELSFLSASEQEVSGTLTADINGQAFLYLPITLKFLNGYIPVNQTPQNSQQTCAELNGKVYDSTVQNCDQPIRSADSTGNSWCCLGTLTPINNSSGSSSGTLIAIIILAAIVLFGVWFYFAKFRKTKKPVDLLKIARGK